MAIKVGTSGDDTLNGTSSADTLYGKEGLDRLSGLGGADILYGGLGKDILIGGAGKDTLTGGPGADTFKYLARSDSRGTTVDLIKDFKISDGDSVDLTGKSNCIIPLVSSACTVAMTMSGAAAESAVATKYARTLPLSGLLTVAVVSAEQRANCTPVPLGGENDPEPGPARPTTAVEGGGTQRELLMRTSTGATTGVLVTALRQQLTLSLTSPSTDGPPNGQSWTQIVW